MTLIISVFKFFNPTKLVVDVQGFAVKETEESLVMKRILCSTFPRVFSLSFFFCKKVLKMSHREVLAHLGVSNIHLALPNQESKKFCLLK